MLKTIKARDLKPGQILDLQRVRYAVLHVPAFPLNGDVVALVHQLGVGFVGTLGLSYRPDQDLSIECQDLTPLQLAAPDLLVYARHLLANVPSEDDGNAFYEGLREFLAPFEPPAPPTAEEMLAALQQVAQGTMTQADVAAWIASVTP